MNNNIAYGVNDIKWIDRNCFASIERIVKQRSVFHNNDSNVNKIFWKYFLVKEIYL